MITNENDIVHYYLGAKFQYTFKDGKIVYGTLTMVTQSGGIYTNSFINEKEYIEIDDFRDQGKLKLILFHASDMTVHQKKAYYRLCRQEFTPGKRFIVDTPESLNYLFINHIDAFGLIERKLAISANWYFNQKNLPKTEEYEPAPDEELVEEKLTVIEDDKPYEFYVHPESR